jgi:hypothetical protein
MSLCLSGALDYLGFVCCLTARSLTRLHSVDGRMINEYGEVGGIQITKQQLYSLR